MGSSLSTEVLREGETSIEVPRLEAYVKAPSEYAPSKAPVFYNPVMKSNRDLTILALQAYQSTLGRDISVGEPLAGCGVRSVRIAVEVEGVLKVVMNDISSEAVKLARSNVERNKLGEHVSIMNEDANLFMSRYAAPRKRFDFIDIDPFGSPAPYLDAAIRALRNGGLLALTATDMAPLCGVHPKACVRKYGGRSLRTEYCHELAIRLLVGCLTMMAAKHGVGFKVLFSHGSDHYIRTYVLIQYGAKQSDMNIQMMGYVLHCFPCFHREVFRGMFSPFERLCPECGSRMSVAGPLWLGKLFNEDFRLLMEKWLNRRKLKERWILKLLSTLQSETEAPLTYYVIDRVCDRFNLSVPPLFDVISKLKNKGFQAVRTHFNSSGVRTDAPASVFTHILSSLSHSK
ncbi:MAG: tRNA (guanine(10)-N(2))-dimethyltransferase [Candidatus Bathyarchaeota archaeon]|nr:MAG: tRNA (guanine(10)-N(2))-dimethyltransferase [Candidatus Bathyarchaeota archaeon]